MRALLVDDDELLRRAIRRSLSASDIQFDEARSVKAALEALARVDYDLIVSDEQMLDGLGHDLLTEVKKRYPRCRRALMSGRDAPAIKQPAWERFFAKPYDMSALLRWLNELAAESPRSGERQFTPTSSATGTRRY